MCAQYQLKAKAKSVAQYFSINTYDESMRWEDEIRPFTMAPIIFVKGDVRAIQLMQFSLIPSWSKEARPKFATHNARLLTWDTAEKRDIPIYEKPTWKAAFLCRRCLVPMTSFVEPIYVREFAGNMVRFEETQDHFLVAAGLWERWISSVTEEAIDSFTIITHNPVPFVKEIGHERSPLFLDRACYDMWLDSKNHDAKSLLKILLGNLARLHLHANKHHALKSGWEKRVRKPD